MNWKDKGEMVLVEDYKDKGLNLLKKGQKGLAHAVFSRFGLILLMLAAQVLILFSIFQWFEEFLPHIFGGTLLFTAVMVVYLLNSKNDPTIKITWLIVIMLLPVFGVLLYSYTQSDLGHRVLKEWVRKTIADTKDCIPQQEETMKRFTAENPGAASLARYMARSGCHPVYENTAVTYFPLGEDKFREMLIQLEAAKQFIFMEYFIVDEGLMWGKILEILVIDGHTAFNGGVNLADEYINEKKRFGHWKDTAVMLKGEAVQSFTLMFLQMWGIDAKENEPARFLGTPSQPLHTAGGYVIPYGDCPLDSDKLGERVYMDILNRAQEYVHIMTPYLILDGELETALKFAAERGVEVALILPGIPDKAVPYALAKTHYASLLESGVKIYEYTPGFVHAKVFVSDTREAVVGTINLDYRSLYHHFECATYMYGTDCISEIEADFASARAKCREVTMETVRREKWNVKLTGRLVKAIAPLM